MSIKKSFGGQSILKPGAKSLSKTDNSAGAPIGTNDTLFLVGEATLGVRGSADGIQEFSASQVDALVEKYGSGPIVDAVLASLTPSLTPGIGGPGKYQVYKTNASTQATLAVNEATDTNPLLLFKDPAFGQPGNGVSITIANGTVSATQKIVTVNKLNKTAEALGENPGTVVLTIEYTGDASTATFGITGASEAALTFATVLAGDQTDGSVNQSIALKDFTMKEFVDLLNGQTGYSASLSDNTKSAIRSKLLDPVAAATDMSSSVNIFRLQEEILELVNDNSSFAELAKNSTPQPGLPVNITNVFLTGGALGASVNSDFSNGFADSLSKEWNVVLPCISQDATVDIAAGETDASSTYTIASVIAAESAHLILRGSIKNSKEAQGFGGSRSVTKAVSFALANTTGDFQIQIAIQDVQVLDVDGNLTWKQPHIMAALMAGIRLGTAVGEPLTHKVINANGVGHFVTASTGIEAGDFNEATDVDEAIEQGVTFTEKKSGGSRIVVDNTTYGIDQSFIFNRGSVVEAAQFTAKTIRETAELVFVGQKVSNGIAQSIKTVIRNKLRELNAPEVNIITASDDAPEGFREDTFVVTVNGNTATIQVHIKPVQGLDFIFITFTLGDIKQSA